MAAILGGVGMAVAPPLTFTYTLFGPDEGDFSFLGGFLVLALLLATAGLLARLLGGLSPWCLGPATVLAPAIFFLLAASTGEDAADYRRAWPKALLSLVGAAIPGTIGACFGELISRWRDRPGPGSELCHRADGGGARDRLSPDQ